MKRLTSALGLAFLLLPAMVYGATQSQIAESACKGAGGQPVVSGTEVLCKTPQGVLSVQSVFSTITTTLIFIIGAVSVLMIIIGGLKYVVSMGDSSGVKSAKDTILYAVVGLVVAIVAYALVNFVTSSIK